MSDEALDDEEIETLVRQYFVAYLENEYANAYGADPYDAPYHIICELVDFIDVTRKKRLRWGRAEIDQLNFYRYYWDACDVFLSELNNTTNEDITRNGKEFFEEYFIIDKDEIKNMENYILQELDNVLDEDHQKEMAARGVLYRACSKAIWNPRCELGRRMAMRRLDNDGLSGIIE